MKREGELFSYSLVRTLFLMRVKKSATKPEENNRTMSRRTIFAVKPIRRQRDHPVVVQQRVMSFTSSTIILTRYQSHRPAGPQVQHNNSGHRTFLSLGVRHYSTLASFLFSTETQSGIINSLKSDFHQHGSV